MFLGGSGGRRSRIWRNRMAQGMILRGIIIARQFPHRVHKAITVDFRKIINNIAANPVGVPIPKVIADFERVVVGVAPIIGASDALEVIALVSEKIIQQRYGFRSFDLLL